MKLFHRKKGLIVALSLLLVVCACIGACALYLGDYYRADEKAIEAFAPMGEVTYATLENGALVFEAPNATKGLIFYPGGKVDHNAYKPLMAALAREGILCVLVEMPFRLAVFDVNAADGIQENYPEIEDWYIGGHSLGGSMAASYLAEHSEGYEGLILLGSYSTADLSGTGLKILSLYGSEDLVMNREKYEENKSNLPADMTEIVLQGGCHAFFGMYGPQEGDGAPSLSCEEQITFTVSAIVELVQK